MMAAHVAQSTAQQAMAMQDQNESTVPYEDTPKQPLTTPQSAGETANTSPQSTTESSVTQNRKRKHGEDDDGPPSRRTSFQRSSPGSNTGHSNAGFISVNNSASYANLGSPQHTLPASNSLNGVNSVEHQISQIGGMMGMSQPPLSTNDHDSFTLLSQHDSLNQASSVPGPAPLPPARPAHIANPAPITKPQVGSEEWHRVRKDNHKEVERRRRETINEGINELAKIVPGCEKNKGSILQRTVQYINELKKELEKVNNDRGVEKMLTDQAMRDLTNANDKLKAECERAWREADTWKKVVSSAENNNNSSTTAGASGSSTQQ
ncbi:basic helix-loop-helix protein [Orbilia brochopaga]|uniref:Basic helix-loop-helix protein n=1 Tax=Orbilia brochopaga TaxID=3140254 RepID=A0AAV9V7G7_9PEZI